MQLLLLTVLILQIHTSLNLVKFDLFHIGGIMGRFDEVKGNGGMCRPEMRNSSLCIGGLARVSKIIKTCRTEAIAKRRPPVLFLVNGNFLTGTTWTYKHQAEIAADLLNAMKPDVVSIGYHEFDYGVEELTKLQRLLKMPLTVCNIDTTRMRTSLTIPQMYVTRVGTLRIGVVAHVSRNSGILSHTGDVVFSDELTLVTEKVTELHERGIKFIIVMGSSGYEVDRVIARNVDHVDIIVTSIFLGSLMYNGKPPEGYDVIGPYPTVEVNENTGQKVLIVSSGLKSIFLGQLRLTVNQQLGEVTHYQGNSIFLGNYLIKDPEVVNVLDKYRPQVNSLQLFKAGRCTAELEGKNKCWIRECNFGNMLADASVEYTATEAFPGRWSTAPIALLHGGIISTGLDMRRYKGVVYNGELITTIPFPSSISTVSMTGATIIEMLETSVQNYKETVTSESRWFLQMAGAKVVYDMRKQPLQRVVSLKLRCGNCPIPKYEPVNTKAYYNVVIPTFLTLSNVGWFRSVLGNHDLHRRTIHKTYTELLMWYVHKNQPIHPSINDRITIINDTRTSVAVWNNMATFWCHLLYLLVLLLAS